MANRLNNTKVGQVCCALILLGSILYDVMSIVEVKRLLLHWYTHADCEQRHCNLRGQKVTAEGANKKDKQDAYVWSRIEILCS